MARRRGMARRDEHTTRQTYRNKMLALKPLQIARDGYPQYVWEIVPCKRMDSGGFDKGNPHYHVIPVYLNTKHPDYPKLKAEQLAAASRKMSQRRKLSNL
jgi:hypothetical protein